MCFGFLTVGGNGDDLVVAGGKGDRLLAAGVDDNTQLLNLALLREIDIFGLDFEEGAGFTSVLVARRGRTQIGIQQTAESRPPAQHITDKVEHDQHGHRKEHRRGHGELSRNAPGILRLAALHGRTALSPRLLATLCLGHAAALIAALTASCLGARCVSAKRANGFVCVIDCSAVIAYDFIFHGNAHTLAYAFAPFWQFQVGEGLRFPSIITENWLSRNCYSPFFTNLLQLPVF